MAAASALQPDRHLLLLAGRRRHLLRTLPQLAPLRRLRRRRAVRVSSAGGGGGGEGGIATAAVENRSVLVPVVGVDEQSVLVPVVGMEEPSVLVTAVGVEEQGQWGGEAGVAASEPKWPSWEGLPERYKLIGATSLAFAICNMDKVNLSVAIIPMAQQYGWSSSTAGLVQSAFFLGFALSQLPGGWLAKLFGGRFVGGNENFLNFAK